VLAGLSSIKSSWTAQDLVTLLHILFISQKYKGFLGGMKMKEGNKSCMSQQATPILMIRFHLCRNFDLKFKYLKYLELPLNPNELDFHSIINKSIQRMSAPTLITSQFKFAYGNYYF
jgi:hypothetical protein